MVERADINGLLSQMRAIRQDMHQDMHRVGPIQTPEVRVSGISKTDSSGFADLLKSAVDKVNEHQMEASRLRTAYEQGDPAVDLPQVMIQAQKASVAFQAMTQVRNRLVTAYEDVMKMPI